MRAGVVEAPLFGGHPVCGVRMGGRSLPPRMQVLSSPSPSGSCSLWSEETPWRLSRWEVATSSMSQPCPQVGAVGHLQMALPVSYCVAAAPAGSPGPASLLVSGATSYSKGLCMCRAGRGGRALGSTERSPLYCVGCWRVPRICPGWADIRGPCAKHACVWAPPLRWGLTASRGGDTEPAYVWRRLQKQSLHRDAKLRFGALSPPQKRGDRANGLAFRLHEQYFLSVITL